MKYAVSLDHMLWEDADSEEDAIAQMRSELAEMDEDDLKELDFSVVDVVPEDEW